LRFVELERPVFVIKGFDLALGARQAYIEPDFSELTKKKAIILKCTLKDAAFLGIEEKIGDTDEVFKFFGNHTQPLLHKLISVLFETIKTELLIYGETLEFLSFEADSKDIKLYASGATNESGDLKLKLKVFFSPQIAADFPEELRALLVAKSKGWLSYSLEFDGGEEKGFLKLESDRFRIEFEQIEIH